MVWYNMFQITIVEEKLMPSNIDFLYTNHKDINIKSIRVMQVNPCHAIIFNCQLGGVKFRST